MLTSITISHYRALKSLRIQRLGRINLVAAVCNAGLPVPDQDVTTAIGPPAVTLLILPGAGKPGMLESILADSVRGGPEHVCVEEFLNCVEKATQHEIRLPEKAMCMLSWRRDQILTYRRGTRQRKGIGITLRSGKFVISWPLSGRR